MFKAPCPSCGGELIFRSKTTVLCVCSYCRSNVIRHDVDLELMGKQADLLPDMSPLQIGVTGIYKRKRFHVLGRQILGWPDGRWNEWYIMFSDGSDGWIAEAQGEFSVLLAPKERPGLPNLSSLKTKKTLKIDKHTYTLVDRKKVECLGSEGELPFKAVAGDKSLVLDYSDGKNRFASIEIGSSPDFNIFVGSFITLAKVRATGLREFEGWGKP